MEERVFISEPFRLDVELMHFKVINEDRAVGSYRKCENDALPLSDFRGNMDTFVVFSGLGSDEGRRCRRGL